MYVGVNEGRAARALLQAVICVQTLVCLMHAAPCLFLYESQNETTISRPSMSRNEIFLSLQVVGGLSRSSKGT
ncbi:hypothetical protein F4825DRAFT_200850 [Nemania diffusa]|nr:hypothetical protein F4825DRAFT_200850 [Nemania diffusa]